MAKLEIGNVIFHNPVSVGTHMAADWSSKKTPHSHLNGTTSVREVRDDQGVTRALFIKFEAGPVQHEIEVPAWNIRCITRVPVAEVKPEPAPAAKAGAK